MLNPLKGLRFVRAANYNPTTMSWPKRKQSFTAAAPIFFPKTAAAKQRPKEKARKARRQNWQSTIFGIKLPVH